MATPVERRRCRMMSRRGFRPTLLAAAICVLGTALACSRETVWQERWELVGGGSAELERSATFGYTWINAERTRGEYGFTFTAGGGTDARGLGTWQVRGTFTAERYSPDYCGRAKWTAGSTCLVFKLWPRGGAPDSDVQARLDRLGLPDRRVRGYLLFFDGRSNVLSLMRNSDDAVETRWRSVRSAT